jgi:hypothetical protein
MCCPSPTGMRYAMRTRRTCDVAVPVVMPWPAAVTVVAYLSRSSLVLFWIIRLQHRAGFSTVGPKWFGLAAPQPCVQSTNRSKYAQLQPSHLQLGLV